MTRDEAIEIEVKSAVNWAPPGMARATIRRAAAETIDGYVELGMLKLDNPERPIDPETRAGNILERYVGATFGASILTEFMGAGLAIVDRGAKIDTSSGE